MKLGPRAELAHMLDVAVPVAEDIAASAAKDAGVHVSLLGGYVRTAVACARDARRLTRIERDACREVGKVAADRDVSMSALLDLYLSATWRLWENIASRATGTNPETVGALAVALFRAGDDAAEALADGYEEAQRQTIRREEALRREFVDDLLGGAGEPGSLADRARSFGFNLAGEHVVVVARTGRALVDAGPEHRRVEAHLLATFGGRDVVVATKEGLLICVFPGHPDDPGSQLLPLLESGAGEKPWRVASGRAHPGREGLVRSFEESRAALDLAETLNQDAPVARFEALFPYDILARDPGASREMAESVLGALRSARGGAEPLLETLEAFFVESGNISATARRLHLSPRAVTYRLDRIARLTGRSPRHPEQRFVLELAVKAARLTGMH